MYDCGFEWEVIFSFRRTAISRSYQFSFLLQKWNGKIKMIGEEGVHKKAYWICILNTRTMVTKPLSVILPYKATFSDSPKLLLLSRKSNVKYRSTWFCLHVKGGQTQICSVMHILYSYYSLFIYQKTQSKNALICLIRNDYKHSQILTLRYLKCFSSDWEGFSLL